MIIHVDMDAFYTSVEQLDHPELRGKPVIVGGDAKERGVVSTASYEARKFGVHSAMPTATARRLCPDGIFLPVRMGRYEAISERIHEIFHRYTPIIEPISLDEAFLDAQGSEKLFGPSEQIAKQIKEDIRDELGLVASAGVAPNKFLAKVASAWCKPDGLKVIHEEEVRAFLDPLPVSEIWGVGQATMRIFNRLGVSTIRHLRHLSIETLCANFGTATAEHLWHLARGEDGRNVVPDVLAKSISHERTFVEDICDCDILTATLLDLTDLVVRRLRRSRLFAGSVHLKVRFSDFQTITRSQTLGSSTHVTDDLVRVAVEMLHTRLPSSHPPIRLLGMGVGTLTTEEALQPFLFDIHDRDRQTRLDEATDTIRDRFGHTSLKRGTSLKQ
ncbi:MAG: DNA polymerase IV [Planctomycetia bacterium]